MMFLNEYEIDRGFERYRGDPVLGPAFETLRNLHDAANANSDGWAYWPKPCRAAKRLQEVLSRTLHQLYPKWDEEPVTAAEVKKAYGPIKAFRTREGIDFNIVVPA